MDDSCLEIWYCTSAMSRLELVLRHCARLVLGDTGLIPLIPNALTYELLDILPLRLMFHFRRVCLVFSILISSTNVNIKSILKGNEATAQRELRTREPLTEPALHCERSRAAMAQSSGTI
jgi:hypothetical protein